MICAAVSTQLGQSELRQIVAQELAAAADVRAREFGAIEHAARSLRSPQIADIMKQRQDHAEQRALSASRSARLDLPLVAREQPRHRQRHIERVLPVVIDRIDAGIAGPAAGRQRIEIVERALDRLQLDPRPGGDQQLLDGAQHLARRADAHGVGDVIIAAAGASHGVRRARVAPRYLGSAETVTIASVGQPQQPHQRSGSDACTVHIRARRGGQQYVRSAAVALRRSVPQAIADRRPPLRPADSRFQTGTSGHSRASG